MLKNLAALVALLAVSGCMSPKGNTPQEKVAHALETRDGVLAKFAVREPAAAKRVETAAGYATWRAWHIHAGIFTVATGNGVVIDNKTKEASFLKYFRLAIGPGIAVKTFSGVLIIDDEKNVRALADGGLTAGLLAEIGLKFGDFGGSASAFTMKGGDAYFWMDNGVALEAAVGLAWLTENEELNEAGATP